MRGKWILFGGVTVLAAIAAGALVVWRQTVKPVLPKPAPVVQTIAPQGFQGNEVSLAGKIAAQKIVNVPAPIDGIIESFAVDAGDNVFEGQVLARIKNARVSSAMEMATAELDKAETRVKNTEAAIVSTRLEASRARADAARAKNDLDRAEKNYNRQKLLFAEGATPRLTYEKSENDYNILKDEAESKTALAQQADDRAAQLNRDLDAFKRMLDEQSQAMERAKSDATGGEVRSPVDGLILSRRGQAGEEVSRSMDDLFRIATAMSAMEVIVEPTPPQLARIRAGQAAAIHLAEVSDAIEGTVREVVGSQVIVDFISPTPLIKPGLTAQVTIKLT
jgi:multidrug resistance efflux pump